MNITIIQKHLAELKEHQAQVGYYDKLRENMLRSLAQTNRPWASHISVNVLYDQGTQSNDHVFLFTEAMNDYLMSHKKRVLEHCDRYTDRKTKQLEKQVKQDMIENLGLKL